MDKNISKSNMAVQNNQEVAIVEKKIVDANKAVAQYENSANKSDKIESKKYKYKVKDQKGKTIIDTFDAFNESQVRTFLGNQGYNILSVEELKANGKFSSGLVVRPMRYKDLIFFLTQLSTYIKSGIPLLESMNIMERQTKNARDKRVFKKIIFDLNSGVTFSDSLTHQSGVFPKILINMVKTSELTGNLTEVLDDMASYFSRREKNRKEIIGALTYPSILLIFAIAVFTFIILYVVPQFTDMYSQMGSDLPGITKFLIAFSKFMEANIIYIVVAIAFLIVSIYVLYKNVRSFKYAIQWFILKIPVIKKIVMYNEVVMFTSTFASLIKHDVFITDSMEILGKVTDNEIYKDLIKKAVINLSSGNGIAVAFENQWAFPQVAYEMLVTGEKTGKLGPMMENVSNYFESEQTILITQLKSLIEPVMIVLLAGLVGVIVLAIVMPMFDMYSSVM